MGTIFVELILRKPFLPGETDMDQLKKIVAVMGNPTDEDWPGHKLLPDYVTLPETAPQRWTPWISSVGKSGIELVRQMLKYDPKKRISAYDVSSLFPTFSIHELGHKRNSHTDRTSSLLLPSLPPRPAPWPDLISPSTTHFSLKNLVQPHLSIFLNPSLSFVHVRSHLKKLTGNHFSFLLLTATNKARAFERVLRGKQRIQKMRLGKNLCEGRH